MKLCLAFFAGVISLTKAAPSLPIRRSVINCRYLPTDAGWPSVDVWNALNDTVGGRLIAGEPMAKPCYGPSPDVDVCEIIRDNWASLDPLLVNPTIRPWGIAKNLFTN